MKTIFVSSTFRDMQFERDAIQDITLPIINNTAKQYSQRISFCDLRWGVDTSSLDSEEGSKKVLDVCLDEIDRCKPPMVVILGDRYGWIPETALISNAAERKQLQLMDYQISVTALEIEYGALAGGKNNDNTLFYFREIENTAPDDYNTEGAEHKQKLDELKKKIYEYTGGKIKTYKVHWNGKDFDGISDFAKMLAEDLKEKLVPEWEMYASMTPFEKDMHTQWSFIDEKAAMFRARRSLCNEVISKLNSGEKLVIIKGEAGCGKSTLFSAIAKLLRDNKVNVLPFVGGLTLNSNDTMDILANTIYYLEQELGLEHMFDNVDDTADNKLRSVDKLRERLDDLCTRYASSGKKLIIMLDAADQLYDDKYRNNLYFIPRKLGNNIRFVFTCTENFPTRDHNYITVGKLSDNDKKDVILGTLGVTGRELDSRVIEKMLTLEQSDNPLFLSLLIQRLLMMNRLDFEIINSGNKNDQMSEITKRQLDIIYGCSDDLEKLCANIFNAAASRINRTMLLQAAQLIAISRHGLRPEDLAGILKNKWNYLDFAHFVSYLSDSFIVRDDGRYDFAHKSIRAGLLTTVFNTVPYNRQIALYLCGIENEDPVRISELPYHLIHADMKDAFAYYISDVVYSNNKAAKSSLAKAAYNSIMSDNGEWFKDIYNIIEYEDCSVPFMDFVNSILLESFSNTKQDIDAIIDIEYENLNYAEYYEQYIVEDHVLGNNLIFICKKLIADLLKLQGGTENLTKALELYNETIKGFDENNTDNDSDELKYIAFLMYTSYADIYRIRGNKDDIATAIEYFEKAKSKFESIVSEELKKEKFSLYSNMLVQTVNLYIGIGGKENMQKALSLGFLLRDVLDKYSGTLDEHYYKMNTAATYNNLARIYMTIGGDDNLDIALEYAGKSVALIKSIYNDLSLLSAMMLIKPYYDNIFLIVSEHGNADTVKIAMDNLDDYIRAVDLINNEQKTYASVQDKASAYFFIGRTFVKLGTLDSINKALYYINIACETIDELYKADDSYTTKALCAAIHEQRAFLYQNLPHLYDTDDIVREHMKTLSIRSELAKTQQSIVAKRTLIDTYKNLADKMLDYPDESKRIKAVKLINNAKAIAESCFSSERSDETKFDLAKVYYQYAATVYELNGKTPEVMKYMNESIRLYEELMQNNYNTAETYVALYDSMISRMTVLQESMSEDEIINEYLDLLNRTESVINVYRNIRIEILLLQNIASLLETFNNSDSNKNTKLALNIFEKYEGFLKKTENDDPEGTRLSYLCNAYMSAAEIYAKTGKTANIRKGEELYDSAAMLYENYCKAANSASNRIMLGSIYNSAAYFCNSENVNNTKKAIRFYMRSIEIIQGVYEEDSSYVNMNSFGLICAAAACAIYESEADNASHKKAKELMQKALDILSDEAENDYESAKDLTDICLACYNSVNVFSAEEFLDVIDKTAGILCKHAKASNETDVKTHFAYFLCFKGLYYDEFNTYFDTPDIKYSRISFKSAKLAYDILTDLPEDELTSDSREYLYNACELIVMNEFIEEFSDDEELYDICVTYYEAAKYLYSETGNKEYKETMKDIKKILDDSD